MKFSNPNNFSMSAAPNKSGTAPATRGHTHAFTLVEVLVVISIVAVLAALAMAAFGSAMTRAQESESHSNLRQLGAAFHAFTAENNGSLPLGALQLKGSPTANSWDGLLSDYTDINSALYTSLHDTSSYDAERIGLPRSYSMVRTSNGGIKGVAIAGFNVSVPPPGMRLARVERPGETLLLAEWFIPWNAAGGYAFSVIDRPAQQLQSSPDRTKFNYLFLDGHIESLSPEETIGGGTLDRPEGYWTVSSED